MKIDVFDILDDVSVSCMIGEIPIAGSYDSIGYFKVSGTYKPGSEGKSDAGHIVGMTAYVMARFDNPRWLIDLSELSYVWGDDMDWVLECGCGDEIIAIVVGPGCIEAISTVRSPNAKPKDCLQDSHFFDSVPRAFDYLRKHKIT